MTFKRLIARPDDRSLPPSNDFIHRSWKKFLARFPTEEDCLKELYRRSHTGKQFSCRFCRKTSTLNSLSQRVAKCRVCRKPTWLTAGTFFHRIRLARAWLGAIWLMEHGVIISSSKFQKLAEISYSTAWTIFKKLTTVINNQNDESAVIVPSSLFASVICKRSRETPARAHPREEESQFQSNRLAHQDCETFDLPTARTSIEIDNNSFDSDAEETVDQLQISAQEKHLYNLLAGKELHFDLLCNLSGLKASEVSAVLTMLELAGLINRLPGDRYASTNKASTEYTVHADSAGCTGNRQEATQDVMAAILFVRQLFHGISRKYLQHYLAAYWCYRERNRWRQRTLLYACIRFGRVTPMEILNYVSPPEVRLLPSAG